MTTSQITWITASSVLTSGSFILFFGKVADMFGRRIIFISNIFLFAVFALATGFSRDGITLDVLNGVMGFVCAATKPSRRKNYAFTCFSAGNPLGFMFSYIFSGIATQLFGWWAAFWLLAIIYLVVTIVACFYGPRGRHRETISDALTVGGIGSFSTGLRGWKTPHVLVFIVLGVLIMATFVWWECRFPYPPMPMKIWRDRDFSLLMMILLLGFVAFPPMTFFVALYLQKLSGYSALSTPMHMLPMAVSGIIMNIIAGLVGAPAYTIAFLLVAVQRSGDSYWAFTFPALAIVVIGADSELNVAKMYVLSSLPKSQQPIAGSIFQAITKIFVTVGHGVFTAVFRRVEENPATLGYYAHDSFEPYAATFWCTMVCTFISLLLVPFLTIKMQGHG
ncbi:MFS general substrate transporter [Patellaria atrata CBS 101060]|uniref:MFS general substrate transporter n=1 Tax=Patellaria atrata CBS 101060 TaxID=1346257 RepID=A0A9P4SJJ3_9PEZI|nr:MFS general substrate transporter [Patellaria atrata CBS 101060]